MTALRSSIARLSAIPRLSSSISRPRVLPAAIYQTQLRTLKGGPARDVMTGEIVQLPDIDVRFPQRIIRDLSLQLI